MSLKDAIDMRAWEPGHNWVGVTSTKWTDFSKKEE